VIGVSLNSTGEVSERVTVEFSTPALDELPESSLLEPSFDGAGPFFLWDTKPTY